MSTEVGLLGLGRGRHSTEGHSSLVFNTIDAPVGLMAHLMELDGVMQVMEWTMCLIGFDSEWLITYSWVLNTNDLIDLTFYSMHEASYLR